MILIKRAIKPDRFGLSFMTHAPAYFIVDKSARTVGTTSILRAITNPTFFQDPEFDFTNPIRYDTVILADEPVINLQVIQELYPELLL